MPHTIYTPPQGYKDSALGWIPVEWEVSRLDDVAEINPFRYEISDETDLTFLGMADVSEEGKIQNKFTKKYKTVKSGFTPFAENDVLVAKITPCFENYKGTLATQLRNGLGFGSTEFHVLRATPNILPEILHLHTRLSTFRDKGQKNMIGSAGQKRVPTNFIESYQIPLPPLPEQRAIAAVLSNWDRAIEATGKLLAQKELRKKWLMAMLLTGKKRLPGFEGEWKEVRLGDVFERVTRKNAEGNTNVLTISAQRGLINQEDFFNKQIASEILDNYFLLLKGEFSYNKSYSKGYPMGAIKRLTNYESGVVTTLYICFRLKNQIEQDPLFFEILFESGSLNEGLKQIAHEGGRAHGLLNVTPGDFFSLQLKSPAYSEQNAIASILSGADRELELLRAQRAALQSQKKGLMGKLLTGRVRVKV